MLLSLTVNLISKKKICKQNLVKFNGFSDGKIVFTLLTEVITLPVRSTTINIRKVGFKKLVFGFFFWYLSLGYRLYNLLQVFFNIIITMLRTLGK